MHPTCVNCIAVRKQRYGVDWDKVKCNLIKEDALEGYATDDMSDEEKQTLRTLLDPYAWGIKEFGINPRDYQDDMVNCTATRKIFRIGRRAGKTLSLTLRGLHKMFLTDNLKIILFTPREDQIDAFFDLIADWVEKSPSLKASVTRIKHDPYLLELGNGSSLKGFTTGTSSGSKAGAARGQEADIIILDEADYLHKDDLVAILPLLQKTDEKSTEEKELWVASTPSGRHDFFYQWAHSAGFKEFFFPSWVSPAWNADTEREAHELFPNQNDYDREYGAEWGEETEGVYPHGYVDRALELSDTFISGGKWDYAKQIPKGGCLYTIGVDWNAHVNGVQIVVLEYDNAYITPEDLKSNVRGRFRIAQRVTIDSKEYTQTKAVARLIELNFQWQPKAIYVDEGFGAVQVEDLRRYGHDHPESQILARLKPINFSSMHEIRDPVNKQLVKKHMKPFMVNNSVLFFEKNLLLLNRADHEFEKQLRDYTVERRNHEGRPVYSQGNDHILDAFNLCLLAYTMEFTDLGRPIYTTNMMVGGRFGEKRSEQLMENGDIKIVDKTQGKKILPVPRFIPITDREGQTFQRAWKTNDYLRMRRNRPMKRDI